MGRRRRWDEDEHPRWPRGSGDKSGEFRDKNGGDWAERLGDALPAGRYGSIATGQTAQCPICGRTVKIVGTQGKLSTHNSGPGQRCGGSGQASTDTDRKTGGVVARRAAKKPKNPEIKAPEPPKVRIGGPQSRIDDPQARERFRRWQDGAAAPGRVKKQNEKTRREWEIENVEREIKDLSRKYEARKQSAVFDVRADMRAYYKNPDNKEDREDWGYDFEVEQRVRHERAALEQALDYLDALKNNKPIPDQQGVRMGIGGHPRRQWTEDELEAMVSAGEYVDRRDYDPAHPLDIYGDLLRIEDDTWFVYQALDTLEQKIPPVYHQIVAAHLAAGSHSAGIYVSGLKRIPDLDQLGRLRGEKPRGWSKGKTWTDPDGIVSGGEVLGVAWTENASLSHKQRAFGLRDFGGVDPSNPLADKDLDPSAMDHEFGHLLDVALTGSGTDHRARYGRASAERLWRLVHGKVKRQGGRYLSPYFKQSGDAGPQELWADAFGIWAQTTGEPKNLGGAPHTILVPKGTRGDYESRQVTWRTQAFATEYDIPYAVAFEMEDYFDRLLKDIQSGKRKPKRK